MNRKFDVIIVGAGPAGCGAAAFLSRYGHDVLIIDRATHPREKVCGDGFSAAAVSILDRLGLTSRVEAAHPWKSYAVTVTSPGNVMVRGSIKELPGTSGYGFILPRKIFDAIFFEHVRGLPHVSVLTECAFRDFTYEREGISGIRAMFGGEEIFMEADFIIGADGVHSQVARKLGLLNNFKHNRAFAVRAYFDNVDGLEHGISVHYEKDIHPGYGWIFPTGERSANVGVGVLCRLQSPRNIRELFDIFVNRNPFAREKLANAEMRVGSFRGAHLSTGSMLMKRSRGTVLLVGDAAGFVDAMTGEGIYNAIRSGELAAMAIAKGMRDTALKPKAGRIYEHLWKSDFKGEFILGNAFQELMTRKSVINTIIRMASVNDRKARILAGVITHALPKRNLFRFLLP
jgi:menaquinone-9 beta-reductase